MATTPEHTLLSLSILSLKEDSERGSSGTILNRTSSLRQAEVQAVKTHEGEKTCSYSTGPTTFIPLLETHNPQSARTHHFATRTELYRQKFSTDLRITRKAHSSCRSKLPSPILSRTFEVNKPRDLSSTS